MRSRIQHPIPLRNRPRRGRPACRWPSCWGKRRGISIQIRSSLAPYSRNRYAVPCRHAACLWEPAYRVTCLNLLNLSIVSFVDETGDVTRNYNCGGSPSESPVLHATETGQPLSMISRSTRSVSINNLITSPTLSSPANGGFHSPIPRVNSHIYSSVDTYNRLHRVSKDIVHHPHHEGGRMPLDNMLHSPIQPRQPSYPFTRRTESVGPYNDQMDESNGVEIPSLHVSKIMWPLQDRQEAYLLRHYISYISKWVDSPSHGFLYLKLNGECSLTCTTTRPISRRLSR